MRRNTKIVREKEAAGDIAEMMYDASQKLPKGEQNAVVEAIQDIKIAQSRKLYTDFQSGN